MDNNVQIFSLLMHLFMGHVVSSLHLLKERIFVFMCNLNFFIFFYFEVNRWKLLFINGKYKWSIYPVSTSRK